MIEKNLFDEEQDDYNLDSSEYDSFGNFEKASEIGRYNTWHLIIKKGSGLYPDTDLLKQLCDKVFDKYKMGLEKIPIFFVSVVGYTKVRKRVSTIENLLQKNLVDLIGEIKDYQQNIDQYSVEIYKQKSTYNSSKPLGDSLGDSGSELIYWGEDIKILDDVSKRYPWQNYILELIYDEKVEEFKIPDDRTIIWIYDPKGCTGKSKFVKWICVHRSEDVAKITFASAGQLRSSLISSGIRKCYFVDIPRTIGEDDSLRSVITCLEDLKNGHLVSSFYGNFKQLLMDPPHIIIFSNYLLLFTII